MINSGRRLYSTGLDGLRFMLRRLFLPELPRSIARPASHPSRQVAPFFFKTRRLSVAMATLRRVTTGNPGGGARTACDAARNFVLALRHEPGSQALREVSKRRPCVSVCSLHVWEHGEAQWKVLRERLRAKVAEYGA